MKKYLIFFCLVLFISSISFVIPQNGTNDTINNSSENISNSCGDGIVNGEEQCDEGEKNGIVCSALYGATCSYCDDKCKYVEIVGRYCGDENIDAEEECDDGNIDNSDYCSNECKKTYECTFHSDCDDNNPCTENRCQGEKCQRQNKDGTRMNGGYCLDGNLESQKDKGVFCNENYECITNTCNAGTCVELAKEPNFFEKIINWILKIFGLGKR